MSNTAEQSPEISQSPKTAQSNGLPQIAPATAPEGQSPKSQTDLPSPAIAREGWPIVAGFVIVSVVVSAVAYAALYRVGLEKWSYLVMLPGAILSAWCVWFFRDPARRIPAMPEAAISPADGVVCKVDQAPLPPELREAMSEDETPRLRVCVFMNVFNVHVNRAPVAGRVMCAVHNPGKFFNASFDKASELNERLGLGIRLADGRTIGCVQIAGLIARRIVCRVREGDELAAGQRFGLIRFGSRVDVYLPVGSEVLVKVGDKSVAGETVLANVSKKISQEAKACS